MHIEENYDKQNIISVVDTEGFMQYNNVVAQTFDIDVQKLIKSDPKVVNKFMKTADIKDIKNFLFFAKSTIDIHWLIFFNNLYTKIPNGDFWNAIRKEDAHPDNKKMRAQSVISVEPDVIQEQEKSKKFAYQNISEFCNDIKQAVEKNDIDLESIQALLARRKKNSSQAMQIDKEIYTTLLPVYFELRNKGYNHTDLCN
jgi:hypothetical protein